MSLKFLLRGMVIGVPLVAALALHACSGSDESNFGDTGTDQPRMLEVYSFDTEIALESSGLARSHVDDNLLWTHNDSGSGAELYAVDLQGQYQGLLSLSPAVNLDWEDMASFVENGIPRLLVGDIGDNSAFRPWVTLYVLDEPDTLALARPFDLTVAPVRSVRVLYPDGPRDAESIAVDAEAGEIYILSKRDDVPQLYRVPLVPATPVAIAEALGEINIPRAPADADDPESINWTTAMDLDVGTGQLVVVTQLASYRYQRLGDESWAEALQREPLQEDLPSYSQIEAVCWAADARSIWITSEGLPTPLTRLRIGG